MGNAIALSWRDASQQVKLLRHRWFAYVVLHLKDDSEEGERQVNSLSMIAIRQNCAAKRLGAALCLFMASLVMFALAAYPIYIIRPFREQDPAALQRALWVLLHDKLILLGLFCLITTPALLVWRRAGWMAKLLLAPADRYRSFRGRFQHGSILTSICFILLANHNTFQLSRPGSIPNDMVIAVTLGGESRAYPIREMGYHHVVNDRLHELPIVVTY